LSALQRVLAWLLGSPPQATDLLARIEEDNEVIEPGVLCLNCRRLERQCIDCQRKEREQ